MPPPLASLLTLSFMAYLFRRDLREKANVTGAIWIPTIWLFITTTRFLSQWLALFGIYLGGSFEEGSPADAALFLGLIAAGLYVLSKRQVRLGPIISSNIWLSAFLAYGLMATTWSDYAFVSLKHWIKDLGLPIMVLVIFTEPDPDEALARVMKRCAYIIAPVSILWIKYYPQYGRGFSFWTGQAYNTGITLGKNALGYDCLILGYFFVWYFLKVWKTPKSKKRRDDLILCGGLLAMIWWLFNVADSKTPLVCLLVGIFMVVTLMVKKSRPWIAACFAVGLVLLILGGSDSVFGLLGRNSTLTERTYLWEAIPKIKVSHLLGAGYESFWLGKRVDDVEAMVGWRPNEAHNGYLEIYINLGYVGLFLLIILLIATFVKILRNFSNDFEFSTFCLGFFLADLLYNWTESSFMALHPVWLVFYAVAIDHVRPPSRQIAADKDFEEEMLDPSAGLAGVASAD